MLYSDSNKNQLAMDAITRVIANCCWLNMHIVPPHGAVFEIRVADGYGARWSQDGTKVFILSYVFIFVNKDGIYVTEICMFENGSVVHSRFVEF